MADALSTGISLLPLDEAGALLHALQATARVVLPDGSRTVLPA